MKRSRYFYWVGILGAIFSYILISKYIIDFSRVINFLFIGLFLSLIMISLFVDQNKKRESQAEISLFKSRSFFIVISLSGVFLFLIFSTEFTGFNFLSSFSNLRILALAILFIGILGFLFNDYISLTNPKAFNIDFVHYSTRASLILSFVFLSVFALNYFSLGYHYQWNVSFFKTATPGETTLKLVNNASSKVIIRVFSGSSSEVGIELKNYFRKLEKENNIKIDYLEHAANAALSKRLNIRENGYISISNIAIESNIKPRDVKEATRPQTIRVGTNIESKLVKEKLRDLDAHVRRALMALHSGRKKIYVTSGHGELDWKSDRGPFHKIRILKEGLESYNYSLQTFSQADGLSGKVPENVDLLVVLGPDYGISENEFKAIITYLKKGNSLLLAVEPKALKQKKPMDNKTDFTHKLLSFLGLAFEDTILLSTRGMQPITHSKQDRMHFITTLFGQHPSIASINRDRAHRYGILLSTSGALKPFNEKTSDSLRSVIRSPTGSWLDKNGNLELDDNETRKSRLIGVAVEKENWRAFVTADATIFSDFAMNHVGNQQFSLDLVNWLTHQEAWSGEISSEDDLPYSPTKEGQALWFYASVILFPFALLVVGWVRIKRRSQT